MKTTAPFFPVDQFATEGIELIEQIIEEPNAPEGYVLHTARLLKANAFGFEKAVVISTQDGKKLSYLAHDFHDRALMLLMASLAVAPLPKLSNQK